MVFQAGLALILLNLIFQVFDPLGAKYYEETWRYTQELVENHALYGHFHKPYACVGFDDFSICTEQDGSRFVPSVRAKYDILILGDSVVLGWGVEDHCIFPQLLLEKGLDAKSMGVGSWNTKSEYEWLKQEGIKYQPRHLVLVICSNDVEPEQLRKETPFYAKWSIKIRLWATVKHFIRTARVKEGLLSTLDSPERLKEAQAAAVEIREFCQEQNIKLHVFMYSDLKSLYEKRAFDFYKAAFPQIRTFRQQVYLHGISYIDRHPNKEGHTLIAEEIADEVAR